VTIASDTIHQPSIEHLRSCLDSLISQIDPPPFEVIVTHQPGYPDIQVLREQFPNILFLEIRNLKRYTGRPGSREHHNELRARGIAAASGTIIALTEDHAVADPDWCARIIQAHADPAVHAVGGAIENAASGLLSWAVYFREVGRLQNPVRENDPRGPSDVNVSYKRAALESIRPLWIETFEEQAVNGALRKSGSRLVLSRRIVVYQNRRNLDLRTALKERWIWGRSYGAWRGLTGPTRFVWAAISLLMPFVAVARMATAVIVKRRNVGLFFRALPLVFLVATSWSGGETVAYLSGSRDGSQRSGIDDVSPTR